MNKSNVGGDKIPHLKKIIVTVTAAWLVVALTSGFILDWIIYLLDTYTMLASPMGWYTLSAATTITTITLVVILAREVRK